MQAGVCVSSALAPPRRPRRLRRRRQTPFAPVTNGSATSAVPLAIQSRLSVFQVLVDEGNGHAALADGRGDALDRAESYVAAGEDAGDTRLQEIRVAFEP